MDTQGSGWNAYEYEQRIDILAVVRIVVPVVSVVMVAIIMVTMPRRTQVAFAQIVKCHRV